ncbi:proteophosphoglycan 5 [Actinomycetospora termitidis]|uniref:Proteophosphoglycan 5 n=1 Tax=Actinomycetospora termitidis TaxID=3053470 RepID=A0ABT7M1T2_9PSEU|nr:proteophosphoglycan 5 [Actinomycetospora sp. Odt1-22]MDL5154609.1 proteophosphoglycan 5 [Actinomycetospora sp. Odt1-22]
MTLVPVDLPSPTTMRGRWAAFAAILAARGWGSGAFAEPGRWHYDDGGGNWADLHLLGDGRAVLVGNDHEYSNTYFREAATYFQEEETDLLAGAPDWWEPPIVDGMAREMWVGFAYGFDGTGWARAPYELDDGFASLSPVFATAERCRELIVEFVENEAPHPVRPDAVDALVAADGALTPELLRAVADVPGWDLDAGVAAARAFRG